MGKRFLSVETNACAIQSVYQPYLFCTPPIGRQTGLAAVGTLSAVIYVTYFVASRSLFVLNSLLWYNSFFAPLLRYVRFRFPLFYACSFRAPAIRRAYSDLFVVAYFRRWHWGHLASCFYNPWLVLRACVFTAQYIGTWETLRGLALPSSITCWRAGHVYK